MYNYRAAWEPTDMNDGATITIRVPGTLRFSIWLNVSGVALFNVFIDEKQSGSIGKRTKESFVVDPGKHTVKVKSAWIESDAIELDATPNSSIDLEYGMSHNYLKMAYLGILIVFLSFGCWWLSMCLQPQPIRDCTLPFVFLMIIGILPVVFLIWVTCISWIPGRIYYLKIHQQSDTEKARERN